MSATAIQLSAKVKIPRDWNFLNYGHVTGWLGRPTNQTWEIPVYFVTSINCILGGLVKKKNVYEHARDDLLSKL